MSVVPKLMGIVNVTPDSFSDGGQYFDAHVAIEHGKRLAAEGAAILDIGGESTRPGAEIVPIEEEILRVTAVIKALADEVSTPISVDTRKPEVARAAVEAGATIWNDVSALTFAADSVKVASELQCGLVLMHAMGTPKTMQLAPSYDDVVGDVSVYLRERVDACLAAGIEREKILIDPGIGFGKTLEHNIALLKSLQDLRDIAPVLLGASRKSFIGKIDQSPMAQLASDRLGGSIATAIAAMRQGVEVLRVHDVAETRQALKVWAKIEKCSD